MLDIDEMMNSIRSTISHKQTILSANLAELKSAMRDFYSLRTRYRKETDAKDFEYASIYQSRMDKMRDKMSYLQKVRKELLKDVRIREGYLDFHKKQRANQ